MCVYIYVYMHLFIYSYVPPRGPEQAKQGIYMHNMQ